MTIDDVKHCIKSAIDEENCENCNLYGQTGEDHCFKDAMRMALQLIEELQVHREAWEKCIKEIKEWYWNADKQAIAKDPCVVDAMVDLFIRTIKEYRPKEGDVE